MRNKIIYMALSLAAATFVGGCNDDDVNIYTNPIVGTVTTGDASVTATTATISGFVSDLSSQSSAAYTVGVVYSLTQDPVANGSRQTGDMTEGGNFTTTLSGLEEGKTYYYATFVTLQNQLSYYGEVKSFITTDAMVASPDALVTATTAILGGLPSSEVDITEWGVYLADNPNVTHGMKINHDPNVNGTQIYVMNLVPSTNYYYASFIEFEGKELVGNVVSFTTEPGNCIADREGGDYVDMGTRKEWAAYNIGTEAADGTGGLYGYGDPTGLNRSVSSADYPTDAPVTGTFSDIAYASGTGTLPTLEDFNELIDATTQEWVEKGNLKGLEFTSKSNGNKLFFPAAGYRQGEEVTAADLMGCYMVGDLNEVAPTFPKFIKMTEGGVSTDQVEITAGFSVRPVRTPFIRTVAVDVTKVLFNNKDGNGVDGRIEIFNEYGDTKANSPINPSHLSFSKAMVVTFTINGLNGNLKSGAPSGFPAFLSYADADWYPSYWGSGKSRYDAIITTDGQYTVWMQPEAQADGAVVFCIDIAGLWENLNDPSRVRVTDMEIVLDPQDLPDVEVALDNSKLLFNNKDGNGTDGRIEIFNEYGDTKALGVNLDDVAFGQGFLTINFDITGINGNVRDASASYPTAIAYAARGWWPSYWGGGVGDTVVNGDGTYTVQCPLEAAGQGFEVLTVDLTGLWANLIDTSKVSARINYLTVTRQ